MGIVVVIGFIGVIALFVMAMVAGAKAKRADTLAKLAAAFGGVPDPKRSLVVAKRRDLAMTYKFADRGAGSSHEPWTECDVEIPARYPLTMRIVRGKPSKRDLQEGLVIDVEIGSTRFDDDFIVEAAPVDVIRQLIDHEARQLLQSHGKPELTTEKVDDSAMLRLAIPGWEENPDKALALADGVARIASRIRDAYAAAEAAVEKPEVGSPYRAEVDLQPARDAQDTREKEIAAVQEVAARRHERSRATAQNVIILTFLALFSLLAASAMCR